MSLIRLSVSSVVLVKIIVRLVQLKCSKEENEMIQLRIDGKPVEVEKGYRKRDTGKPTKGCYGIYPQDRLPDIPRIGV